ncbi:hypothetical protein [Sporosarcina sp. HYO08]|uniref:hypothetical protein n=1 Tax=Sporosarcina sp. HYO08 TaxID=1759557 RepID=UPI000792C209|nr:hypothetical protein [Sporosarcina sp. HYO08]KXH87006.1 hypothetical protein AU377_00025 [Sporosarcina sp. HYO08]
MLQPESRIASFYTRENNIKFCINIDCSITLNDHNIDELITAGERRPSDYAIINTSTGGLNIRYSLEDDQKQSILEKIAAITQNDVDYCIDHDVISLSGHILVDYCQNNPQVLIDRGWSSDEVNLLEEVTSLLCNIQKVEKAVVKFFNDGQSSKKMSYTVTGEHNGYEGSMAISFQSEFNRNSDTKETILTVTILERKVKN